MCYEMRNRAKGYRASLRAQKGEVHIQKRPPEGTRRPLIDCWETYLKLLPDTSATGEIVLVLAKNCCWDRFR